MSSPLIVPVPPPGVARLRFVTTKGNWLSRLINWREMSKVSHVEAVMQDGSIIAALLKEGVVRKPGDYDTTSTSQQFVDIAMSPEAYERWERYLINRLGRPYDLDALVGIAFHIDFRRRSAFICSMLQTLAVRASLIFPVPLSEAAHEVTPRDLRLILSAHPAATIYPVEIRA